ncbi:unnamed protein product [Amoebophrya sp. A120]|nr:unnamed protein product [Amoebophrya sp. A120]|eukprot:GSA120T00015947001.1
MDAIIAAPSSDQNEGGTRTTKSDESRMTSGAVLADQGGDDGGTISREGTVEPEPVKEQQQTASLTTVTTMTSGPSSSSSSSVTSKPASPEEDVVIRDGWQAFYGSAPSPGCYSNAGGNGDDDEDQFWMTFCAPNADQTRLRVTNLLEGVDHDITTPTTAAESSADTGNRQMNNVPVYRGKKNKFIRDALPQADGTSRSGSSAGTSYQSFHGTAIAVSSGTPGGKRENSANSGADCCSSSSSGPQSPSSGEETSENNHKAGLTPGTTPSATTTFGTKILHLDPSDYNCNNSHTLSTTDCGQSHSVIDDIDCGDSVSRIWEREREQMQAKIEELSTQLSTERGELTGGQAMQKKLLMMRNVGNDPSQPAENSSSSNSGRLSSSGSVVDLRRGSVCVSSTTGLPQNLSSLGRPNSVIDGSRFTSTTAGPAGPASSSTRLNELRRGSFSLESRRVCVCVSSTTGLPQNLSSLRNDMTDGSIKGFASATTSGPASASSSTRLNELRRGSFSLESRRGSISHDNKQSLEALRALGIRSATAKTVAGMGCNNAGNNETNLPQHPRNNNPNLAKLMGSRTLGENKSSSATSCGAESTADGAGTDTSTAKSNARLVDSAGAAVAPAPVNLSALRRKQNKPPVLGGASGAAVSTSCTTAAPTFTGPGTPPDDRSLGPSTGEQNQKLLQTSASSASLLGGSASFKPRTRAGAGGASSSMGVGARKQQNQDNCATSPSSGNNCLTPRSQAKFLEARRPSISLADIRRPSISIIDARRPSVCARLATQLQISTQGRDFLQQRGIDVFGSAGGAASSCGQSGSSSTTATTSSHTDQDGAPSTGSSSKNIRGRVLVLGTSDPEHVVEKLLKAGNNKSSTSPGIGTTTASDKKKVESSCVIEVKCGTTAVDLEILATPKTMLGGSGGSTSTTSSSSSNTNTSGTPAPPETTADSPLTTAPPSCTNPLPRSFFQAFSLVLLIPVDLSDAKTEENEFLAQKELIAVARDNAPRLGDNTPGFVIGFVPDGEECRDNALENAALFASEQNCAFLPSLEKDGKRLLQHMGEQVFLQHALSSSCTAGYSGGKRLNGKNENQTGGLGSSCGMQ